LIGIREQVNYEAQAAIELETVAAASSSEVPYSLPLTSQGETWIITTRPLFEAVLEDLKNDVPIPDMSRRFHNGLIYTFAEVAERMRDVTGLSRVCLSGGCFNNAYLSNGLESRLANAGFEVFTQNEVPAGDGGLSLGQAMIAAHHIRDAQDTVGENMLWRDFNHIAG